LSFDDGKNLPEVVIPLLPLPASRPGAAVEEATGGAVADVDR
jgi:hypothetical protein